MPAIHTFNVIYHTDNVIECNNYASVVSCMHTFIHQPYLKMPFKTGSKIHAVEKDRSVTISFVMFVCCKTRLGVV